jgi:hypothetical protein
VLQRVIPNENITTAAFRAALDDLGQSVMETYPYWSVANWSSGNQPEEPQTAAKPSAPVKGSAPQSPVTRPQIAVDPKPQPATKR